MKSLFRLLSLVPLLAALAAVPAAAEPPGNTRALAGLETGKAVFLVDIGKPEKLAFYLEGIQGTHTSLVKANVVPEFVLVYIGPSVSYLTTEPRDEIRFEYEAMLDRIAQAVTDLDKLGIEQEICAVATEAFQVDNDKVLPELKVVGDGFVSVIGYQAKGFGLVPVY